MRVYISCHDSGPANELAAFLMSAGHTVVSTWHTDNEKREPLTSRGWWYARADHNFALIETAEALVVVSGPDKYPGGKFVEAGYAIKEGLKVVTFGRVENGMMHYGDHAATLEDLHALLS